jgi:hypothetical protein
MIGESVTCLRIKKSDNVIFFFFGATKRAETYSIHINETDVYQYRFLFFLFFTNFIIIRSINFPLFNKFANYFFLREKSKKIFFRISVEISPYLPLLFVSLSQMTSKVLFFCLQHTITFSSYRLNST